jgi:hypothetical protein
MALVSPIIRIVCGLVLIIVALVRYFGIRQQIAAAEEGTVMAFGRELGSGQLTLLLIVALLVGFVLLGLGVAALIKKLNEG